jgi:ribonuclease P protein component
VLARPNRLTRGADYKAVVRRGRRCAGPNTVTYSSASGEDRSARFGFIVSKQVGTAVVRNSVRRRLKAVCAEALPAVQPGADIVIRALPHAGTAPYSELRAEVARCLTRSAG